MDPALPWYKSQIIQQQIVAFILAAVGLLKWQTDLDISATVAAICAGIGAVVSIVTIVTRITKPTPPISQTAAAKHQELVDTGKLPEVTKQGGFFRTSFAVLLAGVSVLLLAAFASGCAGTAAAYKAAANLSDTAYVVTEHYAAIVKEAADLSASPTVDPQVKEALKKAAVATAPFVLGDPATGKPSLRELAQHYSAIHDAKSAQELQLALNSAVTELAKLINAVKAARS